jgi:predicted P-loop ATPase
MDIDNLLENAEKKVNKKGKGVKFVYVKESDNGAIQPLEVKENLMAVLDAHNIKYAFNLMTRQCEINIPDFKHAEDIDNLSLTHIKDLCKIHGMPNLRTNELLTAVTHCNEYHPVREWVKYGHTNINNGYFDKFCKTIPSENQPLTKMLLKKWMISAMEAAFTDVGITASGILIFTGKQGTHKTRFVESLFPKNLNAVITGESLDPNKPDSKLRCLSTLIIELGELDGTFKSSIPALKAHITSSQDSIRLPYAVKPTIIPRRTVYVGTVNYSNFLKDDTGNRRFWTIEITDKINLDHGLDMRKVWQEIYQMYLDGEPSWLNDDELNLLNHSNKKYEEICPVHERLLEVFDFDGGEIYKRPGLLLTTTQILNVTGYEKPTQAQIKAATKALKSIKPTLVRGVGRDERKFYMPTYKIPQ